VFLKQPHTINILKHVLMTTQLESALLQKLVVVVGATGGQGGSVISRLLADGSYRLRGITRNPQSKSAQALATKGVEMVTADLNDTEFIVAAFNVLQSWSLIPDTLWLTIPRDANIIYAFTNFFEAFATSGPEVAMQVEYAQGVNLAKAASATTILEHFIWSTLPNRGAITNWKWAVPHCDTKAQVDVFIKNDKALLAKTMFLWTALFSETIHHHSSSLDIRMLDCIFLISYK
jgi:hypothetical protein